MSFYFLSQRVLRGRAALLFMVLAFMSIAMISSVPTVNAEPEAQSTLDVIQAHCKKELPKKAEAACSQQEKNLEHARNIAEQHCKDESLENNEMYDCIIKKAKGYISDAAKGVRSKADFKDNLDKTLKKAGGNPNKETEEAQKAIDAASTQCDASKTYCTDCDTKQTEGCIDCSQVNCLDPAADPHASCKNGSCDIIQKYINPMINLLSILVGLMAAMSIIYGGIQYAASDGDPQKVSKAKGRIFNTIYALFAYLFLYAFLQFLIPGGIFNRT